MQRLENVICLFSNDIQKRYWDDGTSNVPPAKSQGRTGMTSDFIDPISGFVEIKEEIWDVLKVKLVYTFSLTLIWKE